MVAKTVKHYSDKLNDLSKIEDFVNLMQFMLQFSNNQMTRVYPDPYTYMNKMDSKEAKNKPRNVMLAPPKAN